MPASTEHVTCRSARAVFVEPACLPVLALSLMVVGLLAPVGEARAETPLPICDSARDARARNSPAAPALEAKCRAREADQNSKQVENILSFRDWEGSWNLEWEFQGKWYGKVMEINATPSGITGDYVLGILEGNFVRGDISRVRGEITNVTKTGSTCPSGKQAGFFALTLAADGRSMDGWWDVCGEGTKWTWRAKKR
jgi:hypothetical protein